jgi:hypothetical protein
MAMSKPRVAILTWLCGLCLALACAAPTAAPQIETRSAAFKDAPRRAGKDAVLIFSPASSHTEQARQSLSDELGESFDVITRRVSEETAVTDMEREIATVRPRCLVLMGNAASNLYLKYQRRNTGAPLPAVVLMTSFLEDQYPLFRNTTGIAYEVPGITAFVNLRSFIYQPIQRVGVLYRALFSSYVQKQARLARVEQVQLVPVEVSQSPGPHEIRRGLDKLIREERVDAIWVLNDNVLLKPELIARGWLKVLHKTPIAVVVGVGSLVDIRLHFGSFALLPDHSALGVQAANLVFRLQSEAWNATRVPLELPLSIQSVVDLGWTREHLHFREDAIDRIDRIVE